MLETLKIIQKFLIILFCCRLSSTHVRGALLQFIVYNTQAIFPIYFIFMLRGFSFSFQLIVLLPDYVVDCLLKLKDSPKLTDASILHL